MSTPAVTRATPRLFPHTRWSLVLSASRPDAPESAAALEALCRAYWHPLYAYVRRCGQPPHDAQDLTQEFFCRLLARGWLADADREKGRLRTFLIVALKHFLHQEWRRENAQRRGGGQVQITLDTTFSESALAADPASALSPDAVFDRQWALTLLDLTLRRLREEFIQAGKREDFERLKPGLTAAPGNFHYADLAARLNVSEGAARVAIHRLRKRFRQIYREEIARTLSDPSDVDGELRHLAAALNIHR